VQPSQEKGKRERRPFLFQTKKTPPPNQKKTHGLAPPSPLREGGGGKRGKGRKSLSHQGILNEKGREGTLLPLLFLQRKEKKSKTGSLFEEGRKEVQGWGKEGRRPLTLEKGGEPGLSDCRRGKKGEGKESHFSSMGKILAPGKREQDILPGQRKGGGRPRRCLL